MLSDCSKCWETPCVCGHGYRNDSVEGRINLAAAVLGVSKTVLAEKLQGIVPAVHPAQTVPNWSASK